jgi:hypothetical protein
MPEIAYDQVDRLSGSDVMNQQARRVGPWMIAFGLLASVGLSADTLVLKNGETIQGRLVSVRDNTIEFEGGRGWSSRVVRYDRDQVRRIEFDSYGNNTDNDYRPGGGRPGWGNDTSGMREKSVDVQARTGWNDTGITLRAGQQVRFEARGKVRWGPGRSDGPEGEHNSPRNNGRPMPNRPGAALIGKVGDDAPFFIGSDSSPIRIRNSGTLYLGVNDDFLDDNSGWFQVTVYY